MSSNCLTFANSYVKMSKTVLAIHGGAGTLLKEDMSPEKE
ncbi:MAG: hypothetical protein ACI9FU_000728, partial [Granulosicoccus sp.]